MKWIQFFHLYQPPTQEQAITEKVTRESYERIVALHEQYPNMRTTWNLCGSLIELFEQNEQQPLIERMKALYNRGQIELVGTAMYHPLMPKITSDEAERQITWQEETLRRIFGEHVALTGFFFPEMAFSPEMAALVKRRGYSWVLVDEVHIPKKRNQKNIEPVYTDSQSGLTVVVRNTTVSKTFPPEYVVTNFETLKDTAIVVAHDGELYGHWHSNDKGFYAQAFSHERIQFDHISQFIADYAQTKKIASVRVYAASWESTEEELKTGIPYGLWDHPNNVIHGKLWSFAGQIDTILNKKIKDAHIDAARREYSKGLASCAWWWASERILGPFSPLTWNPTEIEKGADKMNNAVRTLQKFDVRSRRTIEHQFRELAEAVWNHHWETYAKEIENSADSNA